ncbi:MAG: 3-hydroxyacyl-ACP dehydratase FabZ [Candidatus Binataceae bacterium]
MPESAFNLDIRRVLEFLPHRYPFLMVDRVLELVPGRILAIKNVSFNEPFFAGHFPGHPIMPGVMILEALAQAGAILAMNEIDADPGQLFMLTGADKVRFRRRVVPGDQLHLQVTVTKYHRPLWKLQAQARVGQELAAEADLSAMEVKELVR